MFGKANSISQACFHVFLLVCGGTLLFAVAFLVSSLVGGTYTAPVVGIGIYLLIAVQMGSQVLRTYNPMRLILGMDFRDAPTDVLVGAWPWRQFTIFVVLAALLGYASAKAAQSQDF